MTRALVQTQQANGLEESQQTDEEVREVTESPTVLMQLNRAEIDVQITTAKKYPRSIVAFRRKAMAMATLDEETAGSMFYVLPRAGKKIEGPSVRLAEVCASAWGNLRYGARDVEVGDRFVRAQGACYDLEANIGCTIEASRRITDKRGRRYDDDMIGVTQNAAKAIALRNAIFKVIPFAFVKPIFEAAKEVSIGKALTMDQRRQRALEWYAKIGAKPEQILKLLGRAGIEDITVDDLVTLQGFRTAIQDGEATLEDVLRSAEPAAGTPVKPGDGGSLDLLAQAMEQERKPTGDAA